MFWKKEVLIFVYNSYIDGLTTDQIALNYRIWFDDDIKFESIEQIIDEVNELI